MPYVYLIVSVFMNATTSIFGKLFNKKNDEKKDSTIFYNFLLMVSVFIGWGILYATDFSFNVKDRKEKIAFILPVGPMGMYKWVVYFLKEWKVSCEHVYTFNTGP